MVRLNFGNSWEGAGFLSAIGASLCCIGPLIALLAGSSSVASSFSWIEPARPFLVGISIITLAVAWYRKLWPTKQQVDGCGCNLPGRSTFWQSKTFLALMSVFAVAMMAFPVYASKFYSGRTTKTMASSVPMKKVRFNISGMTCAGCEQHVNSELAREKGVAEFNTSYAAQSCVVTFNSTITSEEALKNAIARTGYTVTGFEVVHAGRAIHDSTQNSAYPVNEPCCRKNQSSLQ